ncbi:MAG: CapA family protein, partial [Abditibacteriales bacterium]|nr:CapA family protein [Abditibacteriales bacterium]MDW8367810.1 CapA family protein [Abditibacteriales bacterium]
VSMSRSATAAMEKPLPQRLDAGSAERILEHVRFLARSIGPRPAGSPAEAAAARYVAKQFESYGYEVKKQSVPLPNGATSQNVVAWQDRLTRKNRPQPVLILGAHLDTKPRTPGASDNASGVALLLELARTLARTPTPCQMVFVAFGAEEIIDNKPNHHHYGSRRFVRHLRENLYPPAALSQLTMISLDMIGVGTRLHISRIGRPCSVRLVRTLYRLARQQGIPVTAERGVKWSDHEPFENANIPAAWLHWEKNPHYHAPGDTPDKISVDNILSVGNLVLSYLRGQQGRKVTLAAVGDVLPEPSWIASPPPLARLLAGVRDPLFAADIAFANLETPLTNFPHPTPHKSPTAIALKRDWIFRARRPDAATGLAEGGITIVSLANNHTLDYQAQGLRDTIRRLESVGVLWCGVGTTARAALAPRYVTVGDVTFAFIAAAHSSSTPRGFFAPQTPPLTKDGSSKVRLGVASADNISLLLSAIRQARANADVVAVSLHWGIEKKPFPEAWQRTLAHRLIDAGADVILGHHPHVLQGVERYKGKIILFSLGNFVFDSAPTRWQSAIAFITFDPLRKDLHLQMLPVRIHNYGRVTLATGRDADAVRRQIEARSAPLHGGRWVRQR